ncbi:MAG: hypothetical protein AAGI30_01130 [Planctomycetota bacterium]
MMTPRSAATLAVLAGLAAPTFGQAIVATPIFADPATPGTLGIRSFLDLTATPSTANIVNTTSPFFSWTTNVFTTIFTTDADPTGITDQFAASYDLDTDTFTLLYQEGVTTTTTGETLLVFGTIPTINDDGTIGTVFGDPETTTRGEGVVIGTPDMSGDYTYEVLLTGMSDSIPEGFFGVVERSTSSPTVTIDADGEIAFQDRDFGVAGAPDAVLANIDPANKSGSQFSGVDIVGIEDVTVVGGQPIDPGTSMPGVETVNGIFEWRIDSTGDNSIYDGDLNGSSDFDDIVVVNNVIIAQEGIVFDGAAQTAAGLSPFDVISTVDDATMNAFGQYAFLANFDADPLGEWVVFDGGTGPQLIVAEMQPITPAFPNELWTSISDVALNAAGDVLVTGSTDADSSINGVAVVYDLTNNTQILIAREGFTLVDLVPGTPGFEARLSEVQSTSQLANSLDTAVIPADLEDPVTEAQIGSSDGFIRVDFTREVRDVDASGQLDAFDIGLGLIALPGFDFNLDGSFGTQNDAQDFLSAF